MYIDNTDRLYFHCKDRKLFLDAAKKAFVVCEAEGLELRKFMPKKRICLGSADGICYADKKEIVITIRHRSDLQDGGEWDKEPLSVEYIEYVTLHEVAHLKHPNHSASFWYYLKELVEKYADNEKYSLSRFPKKYKKAWQHS